MKTNFNNKSLAVLSIIAGIVYLFILISSLQKELDGFALGFKEGSTAFDTTGNSEFETFSFNHYTVSVKPKKGFDYYPDSVANDKTEKYLPARIHTLEIAYYNQKTPIWQVLFFVFILFLSLPICVILILIPIEFYRLIFSLYENNVFSIKNVNKIKRIGIYCIIVYACTLVVNLYQYFIIKKSVDLDKYEIVHPDFYVEGLILFGLIALIFADILKRAIIIKEEQELTI